jgi:hypothetical protein
MLRRANKNNNNTTAIILTKATQNMNATKRKQ